MSTAQIPVIRPTTSPRPREQPRRRFEIVTPKSQRRHRPKVLHAVVAVVGLLVIVGAQLFVSIAISSGAYRIGALQTQQRELVRQSSALGEQLEVRGSTQYLAQAAASLGMGPAATPYYLDLTNGSVIQAPGSRDPWGCGGACNLAGNSLIAGLPMPVVGGAAAQAEDAGMPSAEEVTGGAAGAATTDAGATEQGASAGFVVPQVVDPNAPVVADSLPGVMTH